MIATTHRRVPDNTSPAVNQRIERATDARLEFFSRNPDLIDQRLCELDREWDIERMIETGSSCLTLGSLVLGLTHHRRWLLLGGAVQSFLLLHALQGWCPPLPALRRLGFRTLDEINMERHALIAMRESEGDQPHRLAQGRIQCDQHRPHPVVI